MEKRRHPRVDANFSAEVTCQDGVKINVIVLDTSSTGLKLQCDSAVRDILTPHGQWTLNGHPIEVEIRMDLRSVAGGTCEIKVRCQICFSRRVAFDKYQIGMEYQHLDSASYAKLSEFIGMKLVQ